MLSSDRPHSSQSNPIITESSSDINFYDSFLTKVSGPSSWSKESEQNLLEPYQYLVSQPGKEIRSALIDSFNFWMKVEEKDLTIVKSVIGMLHTASLLMDDVEDGSQLRRGLPVAHLIFGVPTTINTANYVYFLAYQALQKITAIDANYKIENQVTTELLNLHRGQGVEIFWRENLICPTEPEYIEMVNNKTSGLFRVALKLMSATTKEVPPRDYIPLANLIGVIFQIRDDFMNLQSTEYSNNKGFAEDFEEGKFSFPIIHAIRFDKSNRLILNILRERTKSHSTKLFAVNYLETVTKSFDYTRMVLQKLMLQARVEVERLGGNEGISRILDMLIVKEADNN